MRTKTKLMLIIFAVFILLNALTVYATLKGTVKDGVLYDSAGKVKISCTKAGKKDCLDSYAGLGYYLCECDGKNWKCNPCPQGKLCENKKCKAVQWYNEFFGGVGFCKEDMELNKPYCIGNDIYECKKNFAGMRLLTFLRRCEYGCENGKCSEKPKPITKGTITVKLSSDYHNVIKVVAKSKDSPIAPEVHLGEGVMSHTLTDIIHGLDYTLSVYEAGDYTVKTTYNIQDFKADITITIDPTKWKVSPGEPPAKKPEEEAKRHEQCKREVGPDYECIDINTINKDDYDCHKNKCLYGEDAKKPDIQCCKKETPEEKEAEKEVTPIVDKIVLEECEKDEATKRQKPVADRQQIVYKAMQRCEKEVPTLLVPGIPSDLLIWACKNAVGEKCASVLELDVGVQQLMDCTTPCSNPKGCKCPDTCRVTDPVTNKIEVIRWDQTIGKGQWHVNFGTSCDKRITGAMCSGNKRDGICPRQCFWFNDIDCRSEKTAGYFIGDMVTRLWVEKSKWYNDFMEWVESWSKWIDPKQWMKSWCNPANREQDILIGAGIYSDDAEPLGWFGGEIQIYNYTSKGMVSHYLYTITWGIGNLDVDINYKINLMKDIGKKSVRAFPGKKEWFELKAGESNQGKSTAKAFFLKDVYKYVCMEFDQEFQGSTKHCREISPEGEYRATGDPAVVADQGQATSPGSTSPGDDSTINCELTGTC